MDQRSWSWMIIPSYTKQFQRIFEFFLKNPEKISAFLRSLYRQNEFKSSSKSNNLPNYQVKYRALKVIEY